MMIRIRDAVVSFVVGVSLLEVRRREISASSSEWLRHPSPSLTTAILRNAHANALDTFKELCTVFRAL